MLQRSIASKCIWYSGLTPLKDVPRFLKNEMLNILNASKSQLIHKIFVYIHDCSWDMSYTLLSKTLVRF